MTPVDGIFIGAGLAVVGFLLFVALKKCWSVATSMEEALRVVPRAVEAIVGLEKRAQSLQDELERVRTWIFGQYPASSPYEQVLEPAAYKEGADKEPVAYPPPFYGAYPQKPDNVPFASPADSEVIDETEEEVAERERFDTLIEMGLAEREPIIAPKGREVESE